MALDDVTTSQELENRAYFTPDLMRDIIHAVNPDITPSIGILNMLALDANRNEMGGDNSASALDAIEAGVTSIFTDENNGINGPQNDSNLTYVQATLNLILSGADGAIASIALQQSKNNFSNDAEGRNKKRAEQAYADIVLANSTPLSSIPIDPKLVGSMLSFFDKNATVEQKLAVDESVTIVIDENSSEAEREAAIARGATAIMEGNEGNPDVANMTPEELEAHSLEAFREIAIDARANELIIRNGSLTYDEARIAATSELSPLFDKIAQSPSLEAAVLAADSETRSSFVNDHISAQQTLASSNTYAAYTQYALSRTLSTVSETPDSQESLYQKLSSIVELADKEITDDQVIQNHNQAIADLEAQKASLMESRDLLGGAFTAYYSGEIDKLQTQIDMMTEQGSQFTELRQSVEELKYWKSQIEADAEVGINNHFSPEMVQEKIDELTQSIKELSDNMIAREQGNIAAADQTINDLSANAAAFDPDGLGLDPYTSGHQMGSVGVISAIPTTEDRILYQLEEKEEAESRIAVIQETVGDAPAPAPDEAQLYVDNNPELKSYLSGLASQTHISEADLIVELEARGVPAPHIQNVVDIAHDQMGVNVAPRTTTLVANNEGPRLSAGDRPPPTLTGGFTQVANGQTAPETIAPSPQSPAPQEMTPEQMRLAAETGAANTPAPAADTYKMGASM